MDIPDFLSTLTTGILLRHFLVAMQISSHYTQAM